MTITRRITGRPIVKYIAGPVTGSGEGTATGFTVLDVDGNSFSVPLEVLNTAGTSFTVLSTVLDVDGNSFSPI